MSDTPLWRSETLRPTPPPTWEEVARAIAAVPWRPPTYTMGRKEWNWWAAHPDECRAMFGCILPRLKE